MATIGRFLARFLTILLFTAVGAYIGMFVAVEAARDFLGVRPGAIGNAVPPLFYPLVLGLLFGGGLGFVIGNFFATRERFLVTAAAVLDALMVRPWRRLRRPR